ncbi:MAG: acetate--CoA ligase family protein [Candidatus Diapherotrites archaeon]
MPTLDLNASMKLLKKHYIPCVEFIRVKDELELQKAVKKLASYPLALKLVSSKVSHKSDVGGVKLHIHSLGEAIHAFKSLKRIQGFEAAQVQHMEQGRELIVGGKLDEQFGPTILFGLGGIFTEVFKDFSLRVCPIDRKEARKMISEIKGAKVLGEFRGQKPVNRKALEDVLLRVSDLMMEEKIKELDINPLFVNEKKAIAVDARVVL